jgi:hypothetical protein
MHPAVVSEVPGNCPECGMKLLPEQVVAEAGGGHHEHHDHEHHDHHDRAHLPFADHVEQHDDHLAVPDDVEHAAAPTVLRAAGHQPHPAQAVRHADVHHTPRVLTRIR